MSKISPSKIGLWYDVGDFVYYRSVSKTTLFETKQAYKQRDKKMRQIQFLILIAFLILVSSSTGACQSSVIDSIAQSHIDGNVPEQKDFDNFLKRDLAAYFKNVVGKDVIVEYELLRNAPTQSGVAFPKFYLWIKVKEKDNLIEEGAVRVAAIDKKRFEITNYLKRLDIETDIDQVYKVFPKPVGDKIKEKIGK